MLELLLRVECKCDCIVHFIFMLSADTKDQWARDDPAFLVLLTFWLFGNFTSLMFVFIIVAILHLETDCALPISFKVSNISYSVARR